MNDLSARPTGSSTEDLRARARCVRMQARQGELHVVLGPADPHALELVYLPLGDGLARGVHDIAFSAIVSGLDFVSVLSSSVVLSELGHIVFGDSRRLESHHSNCSPREIARPVLGERAP